MLIKKLCPPGLVRVDGKTIDHVPRNNQHYFDGHHFCRYEKIFSVSFPTLQDPYRAIIRNLQTLPTLFIGPEFFL